MKDVVNNAKFLNHEFMEEKSENYYNDIELSKFEKILVMLQNTSGKELFKLTEGDEDLMAMAKKIEDFNSSDENIIDLYNEGKKNIA